MIAPSVSGLRWAIVLLIASAPDGRWLYTSANAGERITLTGGTVLDIDDAIFAGVLELPGD